MPEHPHLAGFETENESMELNPKNIPVRPLKKDLPGKYAEFFGALKSSVKADPENIDQQTGLEFENIEGEVMGDVLTSALMIGSMYNQITDNFFTFESPDAIMDKTFAKIIMDTVKKDPLIFSILKRTLNFLMVSWKRQGRSEMVQVAQALSISLQESEKKDPFTEALKRGR